MNEDRKRHRVDSVVGPQDIVMLEKPSGGELACVSGVMANGLGHWSLMVFRLKA